MTSPEAQGVLKAFLAVMATTEDASWLLYAVAFFQMSVAACHLHKGFRHQRILSILLVVSALLVPVLLMLGFVYAARPAA